MGNLSTIFWREFKSYFSSPIAYMFICAFLVFMGVWFFFYVSFFQRPNPDLRLYFFMFPFSYAILIPAVTMRLWSEEKRSGTAELLMTFPMKSWQIVLGKFFAGYGVMVVTLILTLLVPLTVATVVDLDWGVVATSYIGALLLAAVYTAAGSWTSAITQNQIVAFLLSMVLLFVLAGIGYPQVVDQMDRFVGGLGGALGWFGTFYHFENFQKGLLNPVDVVYALSMTAFFLILNNFAVEWRKY